MEPERTAAALSRARAGSSDLIQSAVVALRRGDARAALDLLQGAEPAGLEAVDILLNKALALRMLGDFSAALQALEGALAIDPYHLPALLSKGAMLERKAGPKLAAVTYRHALTVAEAAGPLPAGAAAAMQRAREVVEADATQLHEHLRRATSALRTASADPALERFDESLDVFAGVQRSYRQEPILLNYARMPSIPFYDRALFPWLPQLEAATPVIQEELRGALAQAPGEFDAYIQYPPGAPVNQWGELNHSRRWNAYFLWKSGIRQEGACRQCPRTAALLDTLPLMRQPGFAPTVNFSVLEPRTHIPPHTGSSNTRLLVHLPLILPGPARFRVGAVTREWRLGEAWVFDDTIEHEAWNDADAPRTILILDVWSPLLCDAERDLVSVMMSAKNAYYADASSGRTM